MKRKDAIINPTKSKNSPNISSVAVLISTRVDLFFLCELFNCAKDDYHRIFISRLYFGRSGLGGFSLTGPVVGAPYAVMLLETLIAWGARKIIYLGWCGAIAESVKIGDILIPTSAVIDEGLSVMIAGVAKIIGYHGVLPVFKGISQVTDVVGLCEKLVQHRKRSGSHLLSNPSHLRSVKTVERNGPGHPH